tara:strand:- start:267 stop:1583 length:1317 start_codon:yes stop_codon:yes gene_type:complete
MRVFSLCFVLLALAVSGCGTVVQSVPLGASQSLESSGRQCSDVAANSRLRRLCDARPYQLYALPTSLISADLANLKNRWTVAISARNIPDPASASWFRLYHDTHPLTQDAFELSVSGSLLSTANSTVTPQAVEFAEALQQVAEAGAAFWDGGDTASAEALDATLSSVLTTVRADTGRDRLEVQFGATLWSSQLSCRAATVFGSGEEACATQVGELTATIERPCHFSQTLPGRRQGPVPNCAEGRQSETRIIGQVIMRLTESESGPGGMNYRAVRQDVADTYDPVYTFPLLSSGATGSRSMRPAERGEASVFFRLTAPALLRAEIRCQLDSQVANRFAALGEHATLSFSLALSTLCADGADTVRQLVQLNTPDHLIDVVVDGDTGEAMSVNMFRNILGTETTELTFASGVLTGVKVERAAMGVGTVLLPLAVLGIAASD